MTERALYNEFDDYPADWIENLVALGAVATGIVDRRSVEDLRPDELRSFRQVHLFAGIAVWSYAIRCAGVPDDAPVWTLSCPCQPFSGAGKGAGVDDERHLWPAAYHLIRECRPDVILGEQVASKDGLGWLDIVFADLQAAGYAIGPVDTCSAGVGAPHIRQRLRFCAYNLRSSPSWLQQASGDGRQQRWAEPVRRRTAGGCGSDGLAVSKSIRPANGSSFIGGSGQVSTAAEPFERIGHRCSTGGMDHHHHQGLEGQRSGYSPSTGQWSGQVRPVAEAGGVVRMADAIGPERPDRESGKRHGDDPPGRHESSTALAGLRSDLLPGPTNGPWRDADWLFCRDGKWRPTQPGTFPLVDGAAFRVGSGSTFEGKSRQGMLKGYGNAVDAEATRAFIEDCIAFFAHLGTGGMTNSTLEDLL